MTHTAYCRSCGAYVTGTDPVRTGATGPGMTAPNHGCATHTGFVRTDGAPRVLSLSGGAR